MIADPAPLTGTAAAEAAVPVTAAGGGTTGTDDRPAERDGVAELHRSSVTGLPVSAVVDGVDVDAVADAVRGCPAVADLDAGRAVQSIATYLPGRQVAGVRVTDTAVTLQFVLRWGASVSDAAAQIRSAVRHLVDGRAVDLVVAAVTDPPSVAVAAG